MMGERDNLTLIRKVITQPSSKLCSNSQPFSADHRPSAAASRAMDWDAIGKWIHNAPHPHLRTPHVPGFFAASRSCLTRA